MSYDIMVIDRHERFVKVKDFNVWFYKTTQWDEPLDYNNPGHATQRLQAWYEQMRETIPPMNGPYANTDDIDIAADYAIARDTIAVAMPWEYAKEQRETGWRLAMQLGLAFFDNSGTSCLYYPDGWKLMCTEKQLQTEEAEEGYYRKEKLLVNVFKVCFIASFFLLVSFFTGDKELNIFHIIVGLIIFSVVGVDVWLLSQAKKKYEKRLAEIKEDAARQSGIDIYYPTFDIPSDPLKAIIRDVPATRLIIYEYVKGGNINKAWKEWALNMIETGHETKGIFQLAGENLSMNPFEFKELVDQVFEELSINILPKTAYEQYILWIANQVDNDNMSAKDGFEILIKAAVDSKYDETFMTFDYLNDSFCILAEQEGYSENAIERMRKDVFMNFMLQNANHSY